jgi:hypothetical protein
MPLPLILGIAAAVAGVAGVGAGIRGGVKMKEASDTMEVANSRHQDNIERQQTALKSSSLLMDEVGNKELSILNTFGEFSSLIEKIQNRPEFRSYEKEGITLPDFDAGALKEVSIGAGVLLGGLGGAALGTAGGIAAASGATVAVMALGTASTGTAIASLSGAAATNAALAALGGGALAVGGGGMALGTTILGAATLGVGLLVGGIIFNITGASLSSKADEAWREMKRAEEQIKKICYYLDELKDYGAKFLDSLNQANNLYLRNLGLLKQVVHYDQRYDWQSYSDEEKLGIQNCVLLVGLLYKMCKVKLVLNVSEELNEDNTSEIDKVCSESEVVLGDLH